MTVHVASAAGVAAGMPAHALPTATAGATTGPAADIAAAHLQQMARGSVPAAAAGAAARHQAQAAWAATGTTVVAGMDSRLSLASAAGLAATVVAAAPLRLVAKGDGAEAAAKSGDTAPPQQEDTADAATGMIAAAAVTATAAAAAAGPGMAGGRGAAGAGVMTSSAGATTSIQVAAGTAAAAELPVPGTTADCRTAAASRMSIQRHRLEAMAGTAMISSAGCICVDDTHAHQQQLSCGSLPCARNAEMGATQARPSCCNINSATAIAQPPLEDGYLSPFQRG